MNANSRLHPDNRITAEEARALGIGGADCTNANEKAHLLTRRKVPKPPPPARDARRPWLQTILACPEFKGDLQTEDAMCVEFRERLVVAEMDGRSRCLWTHVPNEGDRGAAYRAKMQAMGVVWSFPDFVIGMAHATGLIEFKVARGPKPRLELLTEGQRDFRAWSAHKGVRHAVCTSVDEAWACLVEWGAMAL